MIDLVPTLLKLGLVSIHLLHLREMGVGREVGSKLDAIYHLGVGSSWPALFD